MLSHLYVLTDDQHYPHSSWVERIEQALIGGAALIQLREKKLTDQQLLPDALQIQALCRDYHVPLIINDRIQLARQIDADGVHLGKNDACLQQARACLGNKKIIGISCYRSIYQARRQQAQGADYVAFGRIFTSQTKPYAGPCPISVLRAAQQQLTIPVCAIGGITSRNVKSVLATGVELVATCNSVFNAPDPLQAANNFLRAGIIRS